jgi:hypothetical protein
MSDEDRRLEGGCACGKVRYRLDSEPLFIHCCHCHWCQRESGASFALNALIETGRVTVTRGAPVMIQTPSNSGKGQGIWRCPECCVALSSYYGGMGDLVSFVRVGTLDEGHGLQPDIHIFTESKQPWIVIPEGRPAVPRYYNKDKFWPAASLARLERLFAEASHDGD